MKILRAWAGPLLLALVAATAATAPTAARAAQPEPRAITFPAAREMTAAVLQQAIEASRHLPPPRQEGAAGEDDERAPAPGREIDANEYPRPAAPATPPAPPADARLDEAAAPGATTAFAYQARISRSFDGLTDVGGPADPNIAVGPQHVLAVVNIQIGIFDKQGTLLAQVDERPFFALPDNTFIFDAKMVYDPASQRFFVIAISRDDTLFRSYYHVAVSQTSDPTGGWWVWNNLRNDLDTNWIDYPELGLSNRGLYLTGNYLNTASDPWPTPPAYHGTTLWVISKAALVAGGSVSGYVFNDLLMDNAVAAGFLTPAQAVGVPAGVENFVCAFRFMAAATRCQVYGVTLPANFPTSAPTISLNTVDGPAIATLTNAPQLGGPGLIETWNVGSPPLNAVYRNGRLWTVTHAPGGAGMMVRHFEFNVTAWPTVTIASTAGLSSATRWYFWPAVNVNSFGDAVMGFTSTATTEYTGIRLAERFAEDAAFSSSQLLKAGEDYFGADGDATGTLRRWGDYSGVAVDPADQGLWVHHKYAATRPDTSTPTWRSWIGYVPHAVFVDPGYVGTSVGSRTRPYTGVAQGVTNALAGNDVVLKAGTYGGAITITKAMTLLSDGGSAVVGP